MVEHIHVVVMAKLLGIVQSSVSLKKTSVVRSLESSCVYVHAALHTYEAVVDLKKNLSAFPAECDHDVVLFLFCSVRKKFISFPCRMRS